jgi:Icc-related predicted phosphoesterase
MRALLVSDLHYDLRKLDWLVDEAAGVDLIAIAGDLLNIASPVPLDAQIVVVLEYLAKLADRTTTIVCSGNHDLDSRIDGEKATGWLLEARARGAYVDGDSVEMGGWLATTCAWWEGPDTLHRLESGLAEAAALRGGRRWLWLYHGPPEGPLSWTGARHYGDPELPRLLDQHRPDVVLCGHIHQAPFVSGGSWFERRGATTLFNAGHQRGNIPPHVLLDLHAGAASWWSFEGNGEAAFTSTSAAGLQ